MLTEVLKEDTKVTYQGDGETVSFPFHFPFANKEAVHVYVNGKEIAGGYYLDETAKNVIYPYGENAGAPLSADDTLTIYRDTEIKPYLLQGDDARLKPLETTWVLQELREKATRALKVSVDSKATSEETLENINALLSYFMETTNVMQDSIAQLQKCFNDIMPNVTAAVKYRGSVENFADLPTDAATGDMYNVVNADKEHGIEAGDNVIWNGSAWDASGGLFDDSALAHIGQDVTFGKVTADYVDSTAAKADSVEWANVQNTPATYPPDAHNHADLYPALDGTRATGTWDISITGNAATAGTADTAKSVEWANVLNAPEMFKADGGTADVAKECTGNAATATEAVTAQALKTARSINVKDATGDHLGEAASFDGSEDVVISLPTILTANINGHATSADTADTAGKAGSADTADKAGAADALTTARMMSISDSTGEHTGVATAFDGSADVTLQMPATIAADITGRAATAGTADTALSCSGAIDNAKDAETAGKLQTAQALTITDGTNTGSAISFDGSAPVSIPLPTTIKATLDGKATSAGNADTAATCTGNAATATKATKATSLETARTINIQDASAAHTGTGASFNGTGNATIKLPATIKATLDGNATTATTATKATSCTGNSATATKLNCGARQTAITGRESAGLYMNKVYDNGYPCLFGNVITAGGEGGGQLLLGWSGTNNAVERVYYRNRRDATTGWSAWKALAWTTDKPSTAGTADKANVLTTAKTINGTSFNGSANITTANWGTARNISITDGTNTGAAVSVNGSANVSLKLPGTIKATLTGTASNVAWSGVTGKPTLVKVSAWDSSTGKLTLASI